MKEKEKKIIIYHRMIMIKNKLLSKKFLMNLSREFVMVERNSVLIEYINNLFR
jgi:hypothetical protein